MDSSPPSAETAPRSWQVGTLTYTSGALVVLFCWLLLGDFAWSMRERSVGPLAQWYLTSLKVPGLLFGLLLSSFPAVIGLILSPIISVKSDRHRGKWGRRIPFLLVTTPLAALGMIGLAITPLVAKWVHGYFPDQDEMLVSVLCFGVFWAAFEFATIASQAVFGGLINDVIPTQLLGRFYGLFRAVSLIDAMIFNYWIIGKAPDHFTLILLIIGTFYGLAFMWVCLKVKEGSYPEPPPREAHERAGHILGGFTREIRMYCRECFSNPYYVSVFLLIMIGGLSFSPVNTFSIPYATSLGVSIDLYGKCLALTFLISLCLSFFLGWLADVFHPLRMVMVSLAGYLLITIYGSFFARSAESFLVALVLHGVLSGCYYTTAASLGQRLFPRIKYGQFASAAGIFGAVANMISAPLLGSLIDISGKVYYFTFIVGAVFTALALTMAFIVHRRFLALGGPKNYTAPL